MGRKSRNLEEKKKVIVYCEGMTEVHYINMLKRKYNATSVTIIAEKSKKTNPTGIIDSLIKSKHFIRGNIFYVLFDRDSHSDEDIEKAISQAKKNNIKVGYCNQSFDLWVLFHFTEVRSHKDNKQLCTELTRYFKCKDYDKEIKNNPDEIEKHLESLPLQAIERTQKCIGIDKSQNIHKFIKTNPFHNLDEIVDEIFNISSYKTRFKG